MSTVGQERASTVLRDVPYFGRFAWVAFKETVGLSCGNDRTFYIDRFARALRAGTISRDYKIMATGKDDGVGSQAQAAMSAICFAEALGLEYIHRPFTSIDHDRLAGVYVAPPVTSDLVEQWEDYFNLGFGARQLSECSGPIVPLEELLMAPGKWPDNAIVAAPHYLHYCNQDPQAWERVLPDLHAKYLRNNRPRKSEAFTVAMHMRRGSISSENKKVARNFTPDAVFVNTLASVLEIVSTKVSELRVQLFSQGDPRDFAEFARFGCELHIDESAIDTHAQLVEADVFVMSKGAYSYTAGVLNEGITLYDPQKYRPLKGWIVRAPDGSFDRGQLRARVDELLARGRAAQPASHS